MEQPYLWYFLESSKAAQWLLVPGSKVRGPCPWVCPAVPPALGPEIPSCYLPSADTLLLPWCLRSPALHLCKCHPIPIALGTVSVNSLLGKPVCAQSNLPAVADRLEVYLRPRLNLGSESLSIARSHFLPSPGQSNPIDRFSCVLRHITTHLPSPFPSNGLIRFSLRSAFPFATV